LGIGAENRLPIVLTLVAASQWHPQGCTRLGVAAPDKALCNHSSVEKRRSGTDEFSLELDANPSNYDVQVLEDGIEQFNHSTAYGRDRIKVPVAVWLRRRGQILGGAYGDTHYGWLYLSALWVDEEVRGQGWGSRLIELFEAEGVARGCHGAWVDTYGFQAPNFYERVGYREFGRLGEFPPGSARHFFWKGLP
jgi:ribosomal protein S18 acetylase RimI-like enzyme